jgi:ribonuclease HI
VITVSTDGSCLANPGGAIGWAWINHDGTFDSGGAASGTNQIAELMALLEAVRAHPSHQPLLIESDSQYAIKCASEWVVAWKRKGWKTAGGTPVKNLELVQAIDRAIGERVGPVRFRWVRGHVGNPFNERADQLAGLAAQDWAAGRGELDGALMTLTESPAPEQDRSPAALSTSVASRTPVKAEPVWDMDTLFD